MKTPDFFNRVPAVTLHDPLSEFLGSCEGGVVTYTYADAVKLAGHSCPTVAGAYLMTLKALKALYGDRLPVRGDIRVELEARADEGVAGVVAQVMTLITGAAAEGGFKGIAGRFERRGRLFFGCAIGAEARLTRLDNGQSVTVDYHPAIVPASPRQSALMQKALSGAASAEERAEFARLWQARVEAILCDYADDPRLVTVRAL
ncbi:MAG: hypothetical protein AB7E49_06340 [Campylobacterales bacterium]